MVLLAKCWCVLCCQKHYFLCFFWLN
jgi:hypothetical protein